jgi:predicted FMN-binding regulatory protein PaiB
VFLARYFDMAEIPTWSYPHVAVMGAAGLFEDRSTNFFEPAFEMNRGEAAAIISNLYRRLY